MGLKQIRRFMKRVLNSHDFHVSVIVLVIIDCFVLTAELIIDHLNDTLNDSIEHHAVKSNTTHLTTLMPRHHHDDDESELRGFGAWGPFFHILEEFFKWTSMIILTIFVVEIILKLIFIPRTFLKILEVFDAFIVVTSFLLNLYLFNKKHHIHSITGLITLLRMWRFFEIINGIVITIEAKHEHKIKELKSKIDELETENAILKKHCNFSDAENTYDEYDNLKFSPEKVIETDDHQ